VTRQILTVSALLLLACCVPNLLWLARSTAVVRNHSEQPARDVRINFGSEVVEVGDVPAGGSRFRVLPSGGDATLDVVFGIGAVQRHACHEYVEGAMYHVRVSIEPSLEAHCDVELPLLSRLLVAELF
jgi:hypothetical protein